MGDAEIEVEEYLLEKNLLEEINVLMAGHHCSKHTQL
jgi:beta-lactamase superfamily II metal-dependent hydrolase